MLPAHSAHATPARRASMSRIQGALVNRGLALMAALLLASSASARAQGLPARLTDQEFWKLVTESSEPDGFFQSDNLVSNELTLQQIIPELVKQRAPGGVYLGVGPDQNFTYIAAMRPRAAFIVDIRRMAMLQHLMYEALFEMAEDRAECVSLLISRPRPAGTSSGATPIQLLEAFYPAPVDSMMYKRTLKAIEDRLIRQHAFVLSKDDMEMITFVFTSFCLAGPDIT